MCSIFNPSILATSQIDIYDSNTKKIDDFLRRNFNIPSNGTLYRVNNTLSLYDLAYYQPPRTIIMYSVKYIQPTESIVILKRLHTNIDINLSALNPGVKSSIMGKRLLSDQIENGFSSKFINSSLSMLIKADHPPEVMENPNDTKKNNSTPHNETSKYLNENVRRFHQGSRFN
jgi:hypothetical protein